MFSCVSVLSVARMAVFQGHTAYYSLYTVFFLMDAIFTIFFHNARCHFEKGGVRRSLDWHRNLLTKMCFMVALQLILYKLINNDLKPAWDFSF